MTKTALAPVMPTSAAPQVQCLDEGTVLRFFGGGLSADHMSGLERHIDACQSCAALVQAAAPLVAGASGRASLGGLPEVAEPGRTLAGRYRLEQLIGWGATGFVFRAEDAVTRSPVAVKMLREECAAQPELLERLTRELKVARALMHPNVGRVFDLTVDREVAGQPRFLVMELARGSLLDELRQEQDEHHPAATLTDRLRDAEGVARGLAAMHEAGILHRDIKPANLLRMSHAGGPDREPGPRLVISDFGLATLDLERQAMTRYVGTPLYMAPEVVTGERASEASDIWSLGVVIHELCFRRRPQWQTTRGGRRLLSAPAGASSRLHRALLELCGHCLSALPADRPSARQVANQLWALASGKLPTRFAARVALSAVFAATSSVGLVAGLASHDLFAPKAPVTSPAVAVTQTAPVPASPELRSLVHEFVGRAKLGIQRCTDAALARGESLPARVEPTVTIAPGGHVSEVQVTGPQPSSLTKCMVEALVKVRLHQPPQSLTKISFPLIFQGQEKRYD